MIIYNYRLLMRSTHDHEDLVRYWLTSAFGVGQPIPDAVFMVMSRPHQKSIIALLNDQEFSFTKIEISIATAFYRTR